MANDQSDKQEVQISVEETREEISLLDSGHPLIKKFREAAPGTYKHTQGLASMGDNVLASIGWKPSRENMTPETMKLAFMYHDIGKMWFPQLYSENQEDENLHDGLDPWISYQLITRHVSDTIAIMVAHRFPIDVIRIAGQHHGTCVLKGIADKVDPKELDQDNFRYKTERPDCIESLILMMCDKIEASSRSIYVDQKKDMPPEELVLNVYNQLIADGQFDKVVTELGKIKLIQEALISDLSSNFKSGKRVAYPENEEPEKKEISDKKSE